MLTANIRSLAETGINHIGRGTKLVTFFCHSLVWGLESDRSSRVSRAALDHQVVLVSIVTKALLPLSESVTDSRPAALLALSQCVFLLLHFR